MFRQRYEDFREKGQNQNAAARVDLPKSFIDFPKPMIAAINGLAVGFGITMPLNCDIRLASSTEKFSFAFAQVGVTPEFGSSYFLPRLIRYAKAAELAGIHLMRDVSRGEFCHMPCQLVKPGAPGAGTEHNGFGTKLLLCFQKIFSHHVKRFVPGSITTSLFSGPWQSSDPCWWPEGCAIVPRSWVSVSVLRLDNR